MVAAAGGGWRGGAGGDSGAVLRFGRPCDHAATSSYSSSSMTCPRFSSSKEWRTFLLCGSFVTHSANSAADRRNSPGAVHGAGSSQPVVVHRQVRGLRPCDHAATSSQLV